MFLPYSDFCFKFTVWNVSAKFGSFGQIAPSHGSTATCSSAPRLPPGGLQPVRRRHPGTTRGNALLQKSSLSARSANNATCSLMPLAPCRWATRSLYRVPVVALALLFYINLMCQLGISSGCTPLGPVSSLSNDRRETPQRYQGLQILLLWVFLIPVSFTERGTWTEHTEA